MSEIKLFEEEQMQEDFDKQLTELYEEIQTNITFGILNAYYVITNIDKELRISFTMIYFKRWNIFKHFYYKYINDLSFRFIPE